ncbi:magnesium and cobalt transport protein CorA [Nocardia goodfellowii]|uniref:Magnesium transporter n=1 Tax=Nocardia goodfellowii TaxID=882446 RepID=A0ABS4QC93_9NOCA|nr:magnesium and cobalt transport protein CorA [Nocardia goodfellowii]MBP2189307.1 magnesium transporter [Nocardia goodfellowii]
MPSIPPLPSFRTPSRASAPLPYIPVPTARAVVDCGVYVDGKRLPGHYGHKQAIAEVRSRGTGFVWIGLHKPDAAQMADIAATFDLHPLAVEDAVHARQRPKLERYDDTLFLVMRTVLYVPHEMNSVSEIVETGEIMVFTGADFVVTVRHGDHGELTGVRSALEAQPELLALGPGSVLHAVADHIVDSYIDVSEAVENDIDEMEEQVFTPNNLVTIEAIYQLKREVVELRRAVAPLQIPLHVLSQSPDTPLPKEIRRYMRDVADHHTAVNDRIADYDESLSELVSAALAKIGVQQNTDMRKISAWVAMAAWPTMVAGIYGMNFDFMPELHQPWGYPVVWSVIVGGCLVLYVNFRRRNWL